MLLTKFRFFPFSWLVSNPTLQTFHYPISFIYGVLGVVIIVVALNRFFLPELGKMLILVLDFAHTNILRMFGKSENLKN
jgi:hypothetical protein